MILKLALKNPQKEKTSPQTIKSGSGQHLQFLRCFMNPVCYMTFICYMTFTMISLHQNCHFQGFWTCELESGGEKAIGKVELSVAREPEVFFNFSFYSFFSFSSLFQTFLMIFLNSSVGS